MNGRNWLWCWLGALSSQLVASRPQNYSKSLQLAFPQRWKMIALVSVTSAAVAALVTSWVLADAPLSDCQWDGHFYSVGAIMHAYESDTFECVLDPTAHRDPYWVPSA
ncbi:hypothetical protein [Ralstonia pseudosolanacearum]|uniref:hypothetical protein n=1 Tax=Ralstonia pseudosolanacearum TaxID=1310165 RepID=UPI003AAE377F